jgi:HAD superfamily hydrolase (TIGR01549 family)
MTIKAVIFDLGGVLLRTADFSPRERLAARLGRRRFELEELVFGGQSGAAAQRGEISMQQHWEHVRQALGLTQPEFELFQQEFWGQDQMDYALVDYIRGLRQRCRTCLLSNNFSNLRSLLAERWPIADAFDELVISSEIGILKPDSRIYHYAIERLGVQPAGLCLWMILHNVEGGGPGW